MSKSNKDSDLHSVAIVCHDAGGAEILSSYVQQYELKCKFALAGPALTIFKRKLGGIEVCSVEEAIQNSDWLLCGTSWQSEIECESIQFAHQMEKKSVAFIDHWANYRERFYRNGKLFLPDEIWVGDEYAKLLAQQVFPEVKIKFKKNPYFNEIKKELLKYSQNYEQTNNKLSVLYICEPLREHALREHGDERHWGYTEEDALRYFLKNIDVLSNNVGSIIIRPHPSESITKYDWVNSEFNLPIFIGGANTLVEEVAKSNVVVGCQSMALVVGLLAGRRVISNIPPGGKPCVLPQKEIENFQNMLKN